MPNLRPLFRSLPLLLLLAACSREPGEEAPVEPSPPAAAETSGTPDPADAIAEPVVDPTPGPLRVVWHGHFEGRRVELVAESLDGRAWRVEPGPGSEWVVARPTLRGDRLEFLLQDGAGLRSRILRFLGDYQPGAEFLEGRLLDGAHTHRLRLSRSGG